MRFLIPIIILFLLPQAAEAQSCPLSSLGQNPSTAFPICGTTVFQQDDVPLCAGNSLPNPQCAGDGVDYRDKNPFWYKFTCFAGGTLGFVIKPHAIGDQDYDWQIYDVTGLDPNAVYTAANIIVTGNWSGSYGNTGTQGNAPAAGTNHYTDIQCASSPGDNKPRFETMPPLITGHNYLLLISHYTDDQSGYDLSFGGGTANITDPLEPHLDTASAPCDGTEIYVGLNKRIKCNSLQLNGLDFFVRNTTGTIFTPVSAVAAECSSSFDFDSLKINMPNPLPPGDYVLVIRRGNADNNTLLDNCDREIPPDENLPFKLFPLFPTPMDSLSMLTCATDTLELVFRKKINCNSVATDGTDFTITGPYAVSVLSAAAICNADAQSYRVKIMLAAPLFTGGNFTINLRQGSDGNTIIDECDKETPPTSLPFIVKDTVNAGFNTSIAYACDKNVATYSHDGAHGVNNWQWTFGAAAAANTQVAVVTYTNFEPKITQLIVSNGVCRDTAIRVVEFDNYQNAAFTVTPLLCPNEKAVFINNTIGRIVEWRWTFGNGFTTGVEDPAPQAYTPNVSSDYIAIPQLIIKNDYGCFDTAKARLEVIFSCFIAVPSAFSPNGDGLNEYLYPLKAYKSSDLNFSIYNRFGQRLFFSQNWLDKWDGRFKGQPQEPGTYVWHLEYTNTDTGKRVFQKGTSILIR